MVTVAKNRRAHSSCSVVLCRVTRGAKTKAELKQGEVHSAMLV